MRNIEYSKILCKRIQDLQKLNDLTIEQLAYQSGLSKGGLSEIIRGKKEPTSYTIMKICVGCNISLKEFYDFEELENFVNKFK